MIIFFTEEDLVSFGEYLLSKERELAVTDSGDDIAKIKFNLSHVSAEDLTTWAQLQNRPQR